MFVHTPDDLQVCLMGATGWVEMEGMSLPDVPEKLGNLNKVAHLIFKKCSLGPFPESVFGLGSEYKTAKVDFYQCDFDSDALFHQALDTGIGNWKVRVYGRGNKAEPRWKTLAALGDDHLGNPTLRRAAYGLLAGELPADTPTADVLPLLNHSKAPVRRAAASWLDNHMSAPTLADGTAVLVMGKPERLERDEVTEALEARGFTETRSAKSAGAVLLLPKPGSRFDAVMAQDLPVLVEGHLEATPEATVPSESDAQNLDAMLFSDDPASTMLGLRLLATRQLDNPLLADALALALFHDDKDVRKTARQLVETSGPDALRGKLAGDRRRYNSLEDTTKLYKALVEFSKLGVDAIALAVAVVRVRNMPENHGEIAALSAALRIPGAARACFAALSHKSSVIFESNDGFPEGLEQLTQLDELGMYAQSRLRSDANVAALATLKRPLHLDLRPDSLDLAHLLPVAEWVVGLQVHYTDTVKSPELFRQFTRLQSLQLTNIDVTDITPLAGLPLQTLRIGRTQVTDVTPLAELTQLQVLDLTYLRVDLAPLHALTEMRELTLTQTGVSDLSFVSKMPHLRSLDVGAGRLDDLSALAGHPSLEVLRIGQLKREGQVDVSALLDMPKLKQVWARGTLSPAMADELRAQRPNLWIDM